jgi:prepilin-type N-terminal cleavage/methylation domain-containing protein/prepilin-type processing-associated H-X9-DG protein
MRYGQTNFQKTGSEGFSFTELLVVIALFAILMLVLAPAFAASRPNSQIAQCLDGKRQLTLAWQMYASDNSDSLVSYSKWIGGTMAWASSTQNSNTDLLLNPTNALIAPYNQSAVVFKCPADYYQTASSGYRVRSVSMNGALGSGGSGPQVEGTYPGNRQYYGAGGVLNRTATRMTDLHLASAVFVMLDEHADSINDGTFMLNPGYLENAETWRDSPAAYHDGACGISFADGHVEMHFWQEKTGLRTTIYPILMENWLQSSQSPWGNHTMFESRDYEWMENHMPYN